MGRGIYIGLGSNLPGPEGQSPLKNCRRALEFFSKAGVSTVGLSQTYETEPWPDPNQPWFINAVAEIETDLDPEDLLKTLQRIEIDMGRRRKAKNESRIIDLDILDYRGAVYPNRDVWEMGKSGDFCLPHRRLHERVFVLKPLLDLDPGWVHPVLHTRGIKLLEALPSAGKIRLAKAQLTIP